jgi:hypothetical protein
MAKVKNANPGFWQRKLKTGKADVDLKGQPFIRFQRHAARGEGTGVLEGMPERAGRGKLIEVAYWPAGEPVPAKYADWYEEGTWAVRGTKGEKLLMWRDFTRDERQRMGEIDEVRYAVARTMQLMIHDVEVGRYFEWLSSTQARPKAEGPVVEASENMRDTFRPGTWVKVPTTDVPGTSVAKYGKLAGLYLPGPVWNDVRQIINWRYQPLGETYDTVLRAWKISKALALDTPIPTPSGWTTMGALKPGDMVFDERGQPCEVLQATDTQHDHDCYEVEFSDETKIVADAGHLWYTEFHGRPGIRETRDILATLKERTRGDNNHRIPVAGPLALPEADLPVPPYALGMWLGDGRRANACMSVGGDDANEIMRHLTDSGVECGPTRQDGRNNVTYFHLRTPGVNGRLDGRRRGESVQAKMRVLGVLGNKHIPATYLRASEAQRRELLMGLMDSDGHITDRGICGFCTTDDALKDDVLELLRSLGFKPTAALHETRCNGKAAAPAWKIHFKAYADCPVFKLARKVARLCAPPETRQRSQTRQIVAVRAVPSVPVRCILVSSSSHLFLAGPGMVPTHNTALSPVTHMNNIMANVMMADWHDIRASHLLKSLEVYIQRDRPENKTVLDRFEDAGGTTGTFALSEIQREQLEPLLAQLRDDVARADNDSTFINASAVLQAMLAGEFRAAVAAAGQSKAAQGAKWAGGKMIDLYQLEDVIFRLAAFIKAKGDGKTDLEAGKMARRSFLDYNINAPWIVAMRATAFPFISFVYRAVPMLAETAARKPWKLLKLGLVFGAINALGYALSGGDEDEERKLLPEEKSGSIFGFLTPKLIRMPWNDAHGSPVFLDIRRWIPVGDIVDVGATNAAVPMLPAMMPGGPIAILFELVSNTNFFSGRDLVKQTDTASEAAGKVIGHLYKAFAPNLFLLPGTPAFDALYKAGSGQTDDFGRERSVTQAATSAVGVKLASYPPDQMLLNARRDMRSKVNEIDGNILSLRRQRERGAIDEGEFDRRLAAEIDKKRKALEEFTKRVP